MIKNVAGLIIADDRRIQLGELSRPRALSAMPFGGRYRIIDFILSNMVNSGINTIGISTFNKYQSLMDHLGTGSAWDLDRKHQGLYFLTPYVNSESFIGSSGDDISSVVSLYRGLKQKYVIASASNVVFNTTYDELLAYHLEKKADITVMYNRDGEKSQGHRLIFDMARNGKVKMVYDNPLTPVSNRQSLGVVIMERDLFVNILAEAMSRGEKDINIEYFPKLCGHLSIYGYEYKGVAFRINSPQEYFQATMNVLEESNRSALYGSGLPIFTKVKDEAPAIYSDSCIIDNSMVSDGCLIQGRVENSMLFRGVTVSGQARLKNCIVFQDTHISEACELENVIIDKDCVIRPGIKLIGQAGYPVVIGKGAVV